MATTIDNLEIQIKAQATQANNALDKLTTYLDRLDSELSKISSASLTNLSNGVNSLTVAMNTLNASGVKTQDFTRLNKNLNALASVNSSAMSYNALAMRQMAESIGQLSATSANSNNIVSLVNSLGKLGGAQVQRAIANIPALSNALAQMFTTLSKVPTVSMNIIAMTSAMASLASQGQRVATTTKTLSAGFNTYQRHATSATSVTLSLARAFGKFYASYFLVIRGIKGLWQSVESSMDYVETFNYFNVTMDKIGDEYSSQFAQFGYDGATAYANSFEDRLDTLITKMTGYAVGKGGELTWANVKNLGLDPEQFMNFEAKLGAVTNSVGLVGEASVVTSQALSMLSADLSSLTNTDLDTVMTNLSSGIIGQSRALTYIVHFPSDRDKKTYLISGKPYKRKTIRSEAFIKERSTTIEMVA